MEKFYLFILIAQNVIYIFVFFMIFIMSNRRKNEIRELQELCSRMNEEIRKKVDDTSRIDTMGDNIIYSRADSEPSLKTDLKITFKSQSIYQPRQLEKALSFKPNIGTDAQKYLIFDEYTLKKLHSNLEWGISTIRNQVEQGGILLGHILQYRTEIYCFAEDIILAKTKGMPTFVEFTSDMWKEMQSEVVYLNAKRDVDHKLIILGWFHTHPNDLSVFMSSTDMATQRLNFPLDWQVSLVMNPHKKIYRVFFGKNAKEGNIVFPKNT